MFLKKLKKILLGFFLISFSVCTYAIPTKWDVLAPGLKYARLKPFTGPLNGFIHVFKINLKDYDLDLVSAKSLQQNLLTAQTAVQKTHALLAVNGGFFDQTNTPLGLRISADGVSHPAKFISWWNIFYTQAGKAYITNQANFKMSPNLTFAIQAGPRLIKHGKVTQGLKSNYDERTALGITNKNEVIILTTENLLISTEQLAHIMAQSENLGGLNCQDALNLDGGTSSQLYAQIGSFILNVPSFSAVADAVVVKRHS